MDVADIFRREGAHLFWRRIPDDHVAEGGTGEQIDPDQAYFVLRMKEMYLARTRTLWRKFYPVLHGFTDYVGEQEHAVAGPGQLQDLGQANLDRLLNLNVRLAGPTPYRGGDVTLLVGLYSVPGEDAARALIATVGTIAALGGVALGQAIPIADVVKQGVESILDLDSTKLQLGIRDSFYKNNPLRSGYHIGIAAPEADIETDKLWLREGRLIKGTDPIVGTPYAEHDYMVVEVELRETREDWPALPKVADFNAQIATIMADAGLRLEEKSARLNNLWPGFQQALLDSKYLTRRDAERIAFNVQEDIKPRIKAMSSGGPFETRSWGHDAVERRPPEEFEFAEVPNYLDPNDSAMVVAARAALAEQTPF